MLEPVTICLREQLTEITSANKSDHFTFFAYFISQVKQENKQKNWKWQGKKTKHFFSCITSVCFASMKCNTKRNKRCIQTFFLTANPRLCSFMLQIFLSEQLQ